MNCLFHGTKNDTLNECSKFRGLTFAERKDFFKKNKLRFKCRGVNKHNAENCDQARPVCNICHRRHLTLLHVEQTPKPNVNQGSQTNSTSTACTQVCGQEETGRSCARIVLVKAANQSNPAKKITTYAVLDDQSTDVYSFPTPY